MNFYWQVVLPFHWIKLTALDGELFKFNPNLKFLDFAKNPLKYIEEVGFGTLVGKSGCLNMIFSGNESDIRTFNWNAEKLYDSDAKTM